VAHWTLQPDAAFADLVGALCFSNDGDGSWLGRPIQVRPDRWIDVCFSVPESGGVPQCEIVGLKRSPLTVANHHRVENVLIQLRPWAAAQLFGAEVFAWTDQCIDLRDLMGEADVLIDQVAEAWFAERHQVIQSWLRSRLACAKPSAAVMAVAEAVRQIENAKGLLGVDLLCQRLGVGERRLQRWFHDWVGVSPKAYMRLIRYREAERRIATGQKLMRVAGDLGFSDQAHLSREFKAFAGVTPSVCVAGADCPMPGA